MSVGPLFPCFRGPPLRRMLLSLRLPSDPLPAAYQQLLAFALGGGLSAFLPPTCGLIAPPAPGSLNDLACSARPEGGSRPSPGSSGNGGWYTAELRLQFSGL